jgi:superfamily II DNA or RNA helicase
LLRPYQEEQLNAVLQNYTEGTTQQLVMAATGTGKTVLFSNLPQKLKHVLPGKMLVTVHREELVDQAIAAMRFWNPKLKIGKEMAEHYADTDCDVIVSCVASIGRTGATRMERFGWDNIDKVVIDECHHGIASTYMNVLEASGVLKAGTKKLLLGVTATPKRKNLRKQKHFEVLDDADLLSLKSIFKKIVHKYTIRQAIRDGWLVPIRGFRLKTETDLSEVKTTAGDYQQDALSEVVNTVTRNQQIVKCWQDVAENRQTIAFTVDVQHTKDLADTFRKASIKAESIWGTDPERTAKLMRFKAGDITVLCNCALLTEGFDVWQVMCVLDAAPTKSSSRYTQKIGRGTRLEESTGNLLEALKLGMPLKKRDCFIIDVCDNNKRCALVTLPSLVGLNPDFNLHGESVTAAIEKVEALQEKYPSIDLSQLDDLSKVKVYIESLDLFAEPYSEEVKEFSKLMWMSTADGGYVLSIPEDRKIVDARQFYKYRHEKLHINQNDLDEYVLTHSEVERERELGIFNTLQEAFATADEVVNRCRPGQVKLLARNTPWKDGPASNAAKKYLKQLVGKKPFLYCLCPYGVKCSGTPGELCQDCKNMQINSGQVTIAINQLKAKKEK